MGSKRYSHLRGESKPYSKGGRLTGGAAQADGGASGVQRQIDHEYDRAVRWLQTHPGNVKPPGHIAKKIWARKTDLIRAGLMVERDGKLWPVPQTAK